MYYITYIFVFKRADDGLIKIVQVIISFSIKKKLSGKLIHFSQLLNMILFRVMLDQWLVVTRIIYWIKYDS